MRIFKRPNTKLFVVLFAVLFVCIFVGSDASAAWIRSISSNFDLHNFTEKEVNDLELRLWGISTNDIVRLYAGDLARGWIPEIVEEGREFVTIIWRAPGREFLKQCEWLHLGLTLRAGAPE